MKLLLLLLGLIGLACGVQAGGPAWIDDLDEGFAQAAETGRPLLIVFR